MIIRIFVFSVDQLVPATGKPTLKQSSEPEEGAFMKSSSKKSLESSTKIKSVKKKRSGSAELEKDTTDSNAEKTMRKVKSSKIEQEDFSNFAKKLKKTEIVKRPIEKVELETVKLMHHEFEPEPQNPNEEMSTKPTFLSEPLAEIPDVSDDGDSAKKKIKKKIVKRVPKKQAEEDKPESDSKEIPIKKGFQEPQETPKSLSELKPTPKQQVEEKEELKEDKDIFSMKKLKKAEVIKRPIEKPDVETVDLIHHEFENIPKDNALEMRSSAIIISEGTIKEGEIKKKVKKLKKTMPSKKLEEPTSTRESSPTLSESTLEMDRSFSTAHNSDEETSEVATIKKKGERVKRIVKKPKNSSSRSESIRDSSPTPSNSTIDNIDTDNVSNISTAKNSDDESVSVKKEPLNKGQVKNTKEVIQPKPEPRKPEPEPKLEKPEPMEELKKSLKPAVKKPIKKKEAPKEEENIFSKIKLKKSEVVKRPIEKADLEVVELVSHKFENIPQDEALEMKSSIKITSIGVMKDKDTDKEKKTKKIKKIVRKPKTVEEAQPLEIDSVKDSSPEPSEVPINTEELSITENSETEKAVVAEPEEKNASLKAKIKKKVSPKEPTKEPEIPKLKKTQPRKPKEASPEKEIFKLKHHEFEPKPLEVPEEKKTDTLLNEIEPEPIKDKTKAKKTKPKVKEVNIKPLVPENIEELDQPTEEAERKPRDPIAVPAAAVKKKHSDIEKVELPSFLNFPSEQGIVMDKDKSPTAIPSQPLYPTESATVVEEGESVTESVEETKPTVKSSKKTRDTEFRQIPIKVLESTVTNETVTANEVELVLECCVFLQII